MNREYVRRKIAELMFIEPEEISDTGSLFLEHGMDSLVFIELLYIIENEFNLSIDRTAFRIDMDFNDMMEIIEGKSNKV